MKTKEHLSKHDREIASIRKLILLGMRMINRRNDQLDRIADSQERLVNAQRKTDQQLNELMQSLKRGANGHTKRKVELQ